MKMTVFHAGEQRYSGANEAGDRLVIDGSDGVSLGVRPMEALLASLGSCTAFDVVEILAKRRTPVESYRIELSGERAEEHPRRDTRILVRHVVSGARPVLDLPMTRAAGASGSGAHERTLRRA